MKLEDKKKLIEDNNRAIKKYLPKLIALDVGWCVNLFRFDYIRQLESGEYAVGREEKMSEDDVLYEEVFPEDQVEQAVDFFIKKRIEHELGYDFEYEED